MSKTILICVLLVAICSEVMVQPGVGQVVQPPPTPSLLPPGTSGDVLQCWSSILSIQGCALEIFRSLSFGFGGQIGIGPSCCKAIISIQDSCWPKMFPQFPFFPSSLKGFCAMGASLAFAPSAEV